MVEPKDAKKTTKARSPARKRLVRRLVFAAIGLVAAVLIGLSLVPDPVPVDLVSVRRGPLRISVDEDGTTRVKDRYVVLAPLAGRLARIELHAGDLLEEGDVIARILPSEAPLLDARTRAELAARVAATSAGVRQAESAVSRARTAAEQSARDLERTRALATQGTLSTQQLERAEAEARARREELASTEFGVRIARHELTMARASGGAAAAPAADAAPFEVRSPVRGRVLRVLHPGDGPVAPGTQLLELGDPSALEVVVDVLTSDAVRIRPGARVAIDRWGGDAELEGRVRLVEPSAFTRVSALGIEEQRVNVIVDLVQPHAVWAALGDGYRVEASIVVDEVTNALLLPELAVFRSDDAPAVFERAGDVARLRRLRVGRRNGVEVEVLDGIGAAATVVLHPGERVVDGVRIAPR